MSRVKKTKHKNDSPDPSTDWSTVGKRIEWVLLRRFAGNRSEMARSIGLTATAVSRVVLGVRPPGRRMLTAIIDKLQVDAGWLLRGVGEPFVATSGDEGGPIWLPVSERLFAERLPGQLRRLTDSPVVLPALRSSSQYWFRLQRGQPVLAAREYGFLLGDLLHLETDPAQFPAREKLHDKLCVIRSGPKAKTAARLAAVTFVRGYEGEGPSRIEIDTFEDREAGDQHVEEFVVRRYPSGELKALSRRGKLVRDSKRSRVVFPSREDELMQTYLCPAVITHEDIVAVWTSLLYRRS